MRGFNRNYGAPDADAYLSWWQLAGVDSAVGDAPVNWLRPSPRVGTGAKDTVPPASMPQDIAGFLDMLAHGPEQPERRWPSPALLPTGPLDASLMVITDMPDPADLTAGALLSDKAGLLFDAMLRAAGLDRQSVHLASLFTARPPGGMVEAADLDTAARRMLMHVHLARPRRLLILGDRTTRALLATNDDSGSQGLRDFKHDGGILPAIATFHPRLLLGQPAAKAACWRALQCLIEETAS